MNGIKSGGRIASRPFNIFLVLAILAFICLASLITGGWGYYALGEREFDLGMEAYHASDCERAVSHLERFVTNYRLSLNPNINPAKNTLAECEILINAGKAWQQGNYDESLKLFESYLRAYPEGEHNASVGDQVERIYME